MLQFEKLQYSRLPQKKLAKISGGFNRGGYNFGKSVRHIVDAIGSVAGIRGILKSIR